jgi:hypothetical protein
LNDVGTPAVNPVVKWKKWPAVGIEFSGIGDKERELIFRYVFRLQRKKLRS